MTDEPRREPVSRRGARRRHRLRDFLAIGTFFLVATAVGLVIATRQQEASVERVGELSGVLADAGGPFVNYLLVGSDTREGADPNSPDFGGIGLAEETGGHRSDTIMLLHVDNERKRTSLMSIPRDLWVDIPGFGSDRINRSYTFGPDVLVQTIQQNLGIPVNHYVEVDFNSFKRLIGALGGVDVCFDFPTRDVNTGLNVPSPGCYTLDALQSLAYARSRYYETYQDGEWVVDGRADLGRVARQQAFVEAAVKKAIDQTASNPLRASELIDAAVSSLRVDPGTDLSASAEYLRPLAGGGIARYSLPVVPEDIDGKAVLVLGADAPSVLRYFAGLDEPPAP